MSTITFAMELRGQMVQCSVEVYRSRGQICFEEEVVVEHPDWELTTGEMANMQQNALAFFEEGDIE